MARISIPWTGGDFDGPVEIPEQPPGIYALVRFDEGRAGDGPPTVETVVGRLA